MTKSAVVLLAMLSLSTGSNADSHKDPSKDNFRNAINGYLERNCVFVYPRYTGYPVTLELPGVNSGANKTETYEALTSVGMFDTVDGSVVKKKLMSFNDETYTVKTRTYSLSEKGKAAVVEQVNSWSGSEKGFCAATLHVTEIKNYSEPAQRNGLIISKVNYTVSPKNVEDWANVENWVQSNKILKAFPKLAKKLVENQEMSNVVVLMNDGWVHEREM